MVEVPFGRMASYVAAFVIVACGSSGGSSGGAAGGPTVGSSGGPDGGGAVAIEGDSGVDSGTPSDPDTGPPPPPPKVDITNETLEVLGATRTYVLAVPKNYDATKSYPLIMAFHGDSGNGAGMRTGFKIEEYSGYDAFVVYPDAKTAATWDLYTPPASNADNAFVLALVAHLKGKYSIDTTRVFGAGYSGGAFFINQVACRYTGFFRAIAPNAGGAPNEPDDPAASYWKPYYTKCAGQTGGVAAMVFQGTDDPVVTPDSGEFDAQYWAYVNGCDSSKETRVATTPSPCLKHVTCPADKPVLYCPIPNIGHGVWVDAAKESWVFFKSL